MKKRAIICFSGGLDSTTVLAYALDKGYECHCLSFDYGQKHRAELLAGARIAAHFQVPRQVFRIDLSQFGGSALTDDTLTVPDYDDSEDIPITYVPARNTVFLSIALAFAETHEADCICIGVSAVDYSGYPDCRPEYIAAFEAMANLATKAGVNGNKLSIETPLIDLTKAETIQLGNRLGVDYSQTVSCYRANAAGEACGTCDSCALRQTGFLDAGLEDPTRYYAA